MSNGWLTWAFQQIGLKTGEKFVLVALADHADEDGYCYPSQERMAHYTSMSERSIRTHCENLEAKNFVFRKKDRMRGRRYHHYTYQLTSPSQIDPPPENLSARKNQPKPPEKPAKGTGKPFRLTLNEPSIEPSSLSAQAPTPRFEEFWTEWKKAGLANRGESKAEANKAFNKLQAEEKRSATDHATELQRLLLRDNGKDCSMLHAVRYLKQKRWESLTQSKVTDQVQVDSRYVLIGPGEIGWDEWVGHAKRPASRA